MASSHMVRIDLEDGLALPNGAVHATPYRCILYCRVPANWLVDQSLQKDKVDVLLAQMYGPTWQRGNSDGSRYVVRRLNAHLLTATEEAAKPWLALAATLKRGGDRLFCYTASTDGRIAKVSADQL